MAARGAKYRWKEGKILHTSSLWKSPTKRRLPRILIEDRALEVGIQMYLEQSWMVFEETKEKSENISTTGSIPLEFYLNRYQLIPSEIKGEDTYKWFTNPHNALLVWGIQNKYFAKPIKR